MNINLIKLRAYGLAAVTDAFGKGRVEPIGRTIQGISYYVITYSSIRYTQLAWPVGNIRKTK